MKQSVSLAQVLSMNRISKPLLIALPAFMVVMALFVKATPSQQYALMCSCNDNVEYDTKLPMSHPTNRCATQQKSAVSWSSWFSGKSRSSQFHYLDLLELLTRGNDNNTTANRAERNS